MFTNLIIAIVTLFQAFSYSSAAFFYWNSKPEDDIFIVFL